MAECNSCHDWNCRVPKASDPAHPGVGIPLDVADRSVVGEGEPETELEPADAGT